MAMLNSQMVDHIKYIVNILVRWCGMHMSWLSISCCVHCTWKGSARIGTVSAEVLRWFYTLIAAWEPRMRPCRPTASPIKYIVNGLMNVDCSPYLYNSVYIDCIYYIYIILYMSNLDVCVSWVAAHTSAPFGVCCAVWWPCLIILGFVAHQRINQLREHKIFHQRYHSECLKWGDEHIHSLLWCFQTTGHGFDP